MYVQGTHRLQIGLFCLEDFIGTDAPVRVVDAFCEQIDYAALDFRGKFTQDNCRPNYHPSLLLRLYIYGYLNGIRSSRKLESECRRNLEVMWLCNNISPKYHTTSRFSKKALRSDQRSVPAICCPYVQVASYWLENRCHRQHQVPGTEQP
jgi:transposase